MASAVMSQQQSSHTKMTQSYKREMSQQSFSIKSPDVDLKDVEADFQSLVNEMAKDGGSSNQRVNQSSFSSRSQYTVTNGVKQQSSSQSSLSVKSKSFKPSNDIGIVTATPARVVPNKPIDYTQRGGGDSEVVIEKSMRVRDRIRNLEKQLSTEDISNSPIPEALMSPKYKSSSVKNLAEQYAFAQTESTPPAINAQAFSHAKDSVELIGGSSEFKGVKNIASVFDRAEMSSQEDISSRRVEGDFRSVKETATNFQKPFEVLPRSRLMAKQESRESSPEELESPVAVLPPATMRKPIANPPSPVIEPIATIAPSNVEVASNPWTKPEPTKQADASSLLQDLDCFEEALDECKKISTETTHLTSDAQENTSHSPSIPSRPPIQYSAKVTCEVRSRTTPEVIEQNPFFSQSDSTISSSSTSRLSRSEVKKSTVTSRTYSGQNGIGSSSSTEQREFTSTSSVPPRPTPPTSTGKPPMYDSFEPNKLSLLRSSSTGSVATELREAKNMTRIASEKDLPKFSIKNNRPVAARKFWRMFMLIFQ